MGRPLSPKGLRVLIGFEPRRSRVRKDEFELSFVSTELFPHVLYELKHI